MRIKYFLNKKYVNLKQTLSIFYNGLVNENMCYYLETMI